MKKIFLNDAVLCNALKDLNFNKNNYLYSIYLTFKHIDYIDIYIWYLPTSVFVNIGTRNDGKTRSKYYRINSN